MRETWSEMHQNALWDSFGDAVAFLQGITRFRRKLSKKNSPIVKLDTRATHFHAQPPNGQGMVFVSEHISTCVRKADKDVLSPQFTVLHVAFMRKMPQDVV